ncbi:MAG: lysine 2,3-aminomutase, partial [Syntrophaceae bacterium]|nr:lysine 2,3-aminomutase [Syntrophaceae bacterium]
MNKATSHFKNASAKDWQDWRWQFKNRVTKIESLDKLLGKTGLDKDSFKSLTAIYPLAITPYYLSLIKSCNENDPVFMQSVPCLREISLSGKMPEDPLEEDTHMPVPKLIHRYSDRCLAIVTENCAVYCRHCNRKRFWSRP